MFHRELGKQETCFLIISCFQRQCLENSVAVFSHQFCCECCYVHIKT